MKVLCFFLFSTHLLYAQSATPTEIANWKEQAHRVQILRDHWGIAHIYGKSDADAVFGMLYAQAEDDFERIEMNYINALGRLAEVEGESKLYHDLRTQLFQDSTFAIRHFSNTSPELKKLLYAFADGLNYFLYTHPNIKPKLIKRFQPWMPLLFSEGSIGGDIETISLAKIKEFYGRGNDIPSPEEAIRFDDENEPKGSNGFAISPQRSATGNALLLINPHTSFYFRPEIHVNSEQGMNVYGAVTWGQFFVYQGFNQNCGWIHTSSKADAIDEYLETVVIQGKAAHYKYADSLRAMRTQKIILNYKKDNTLYQKEFTAYYTHHGPIVAKQGANWISVKIMQEPINALMQSFYRTQAGGLADFKKELHVQTNTSNNTVYADRHGNIAYWHGNFIPRRNPAFNYSLPVDGGNPETEWKDLHPLSEIIQLLNPASGWIQNCNSTPFSAAGPSSPSKNIFPTYMAPDYENARGIHAVRVLSRESRFTLDKLIKAAYDPHLPGFERLIPSLIQAYYRIEKTNDTLRLKWRKPIQQLQRWDYTYSTNSVAMTLAYFWAQQMKPFVEAQVTTSIGQLDVMDLISQTTDEKKVELFVKVLYELQRDWGSWKIQWGKVNRFQRLTGKIDEIFDDNKPSIPIAFTSSFYGSLAAYGSKKYPGTKKMYGYVGNSFVAVVEFGYKIKAKSILAGGVSSNPKSNHFTDQALMYSKPTFKDVLFYKEDVEKNLEEKYHPGERGKSK